MLGLTLGVPALAFSIACAFAYSASDYFRKDAAQRIDAVQTLFYAFALEIPVLALWMALSSEARLDAGYLAPGLLAALIGFGANLLFIVAIGRSPLSLMVPLLALVPVLTALVSGVVLGEWPSLTQSAGIIFVTLGLIGLFVPSEGARHPLAVWRNLAREPGVLPMSGVVVLWSIQPPVDKICLSYASVGVHGVVQLVILTITAGAWLIVRGGWRAFALPPGAAKPLCGVALTAGLGYGLQLVAYQLTLVAIVELIKRTLGLVGSMILGRVYFREPITTPKVVGMTIIVMGLPLVLLG